MSLTDRIEAARQTTAGTAPTGRLEKVTAQRTLDPFAQVKQNVHSGLLDALGPKLYDARMEPSELGQRVRQTLQSVLDATDVPMTSSDRGRIAQEIADEILGYGPLEPLLRDPEVTEVMVN